MQELRAQEIDEVGLLESLEALIGDHNRRARGKTQFILEPHGDVNALPPTMRVHIFHIVQEGLTNAVKHAQASNVRAVVRVCLAQHGAPESDTGPVEVTIVDDGVGMVREVKGEAGFGLGLVGIRERALLLGGQMTVRSGPDKGLIFNVTIPVSTPELFCIG